MHRTATCWPLEWKTVELLMEVARMAQARIAAAAVFVISQTAHMAACENSAAWGSPALSEDDGIERGDGGFWVPGDDGGTWFLSSTPLVRPLRATPELKKLCMLRGGNLNGGSDYEENSQGTWIGDVPMILGRPGTWTQDREGAHTTYTYALPRDGADVARQKTGADGTPLKQVRLALAFERVDAVWPPASDGVPMDNPYFLIRIDASGLQAPDCWAPHAQESATPCSECKRRDRDFFLCKDIVEQIEDCYAH